MMVQIIYPSKQLIANCHCSIKCVESANDFLDSLHGGKSLGSLVCVCCECMCVCARAHVHVCVPIPKALHSFIQRHHYKTTVVYRDFE